MINDELINKRSICHALIYSTSNPDVIIPIKGIVEDIHFEEDIPHYSIKLIKFYDNINFLKEHFYDKPFLFKHKSKSKIIPIPNFNSVVSLENWFIDKCVHRFCIESSFVMKTKNEMIELFNKIEEYITFKHLKAIKASTMRTPYLGPLKISSNVEYKQRLKRMYGDKFNDSEFDTFFNFI